MTGLRTAGRTHLYRRARAAQLPVFAVTPDRNSVITRAYATGKYSQKEIAQAFILHYATVSRIVKPKVLYLPMIKLKTMMNVALHDLTPRLHF